MKWSGITTTVFLLGFGTSLYFAVKAAIYKKQKLDNIDSEITAWLKTEMKILLNEEIERATLVGEGWNNIRIINTPYNGDNSLTNL